MLIDTMDDFKTCLKALGWKLVKHDDASDYYALLRLNDRIVMSSIGKRDTRLLPKGTLCLSMSGYVYEELTSIADTFIFRENKHFARGFQIYASGSLFIDQKKIGYSEVARKMQELIDWANSCNIEAGVKELRELPTNCIGAKPIWHMAALAVIGDVEKLGCYQASFAAGERLGFMPYITIDHINRALDFAQHRRADPNWLPKYPKLRV